MDASCFFCLVAGIIGLNVVCWSGFSRGMEAPKKWDLSKCVDGRLESEPLSAVVGIGVNDKKRNKNWITMRCSFKVVPYLCEEENDGECSRHAAEPLTTDRGKWPRRIDAEEPGVSCSTHGSEECSDPDWTCSDLGACNAYEKTLRLCIPKLRAEPYDCWVNPNDLSGDVRAEAPSFPAWWLGGGIVSVLFSLCGCSFYLFLLREESHSKRDCCAKLVAHLVASVCAAGIAVGLVFVVLRVLSLIIDDDDDDGSSVVAKEVTLLDLANSMGIDLNATNALGAMAEPEVEGFPWETVGIVAGSTVGGCCLLCCCCALCANLLGDGERAREQAIAGNKGSADVFAVGSMVKLASGVEGGNIIGGPLKSDDEAMIVRVDTHEPSIQVCFNSKYWFYSTSELEAASAAEGENAAEGELGRVVSEPDAIPQSKSSFILSSKRSGASANISRKELTRSVSSASTLSKKQVIGHVVLSGVEGQQQFYKSLISKIDVFPASGADVTASNDGVSEASHRCIQAWGQERFVKCPSSFKLEAGDLVRVDSNKQDVEKLCAGRGVTWNDDKTSYLGRDGSVMGTDFVGPGVRVKFSDGHWWSYHPSCLWVNAGKLSPTRKEEVEKMAIAA